MRLDSIKKIIYGEEQENYDRLCAEYQTLADAFDANESHMSNEEKEMLLKKIDCKYSELDNAINPIELDSDVIALAIYGFIMSTDNEEFLVNNAKLLDCESLKDIDHFRKVKNTKYVSEHLLKQAQSGVFHESDIDFLVNMIMISRQNPNDYETIVEEFGLLDDGMGAEVSKVLAAVYLANGKESFELLKKATIAGYSIYGETPIKSIADSKAKKYDVTDITITITSPSSGYSKLNDEEIAGLIMFPEIIYDQNNRLRSADEIRETLYERISTEAKEYNGEKEINPTAIYEEEPISYIEGYHIEQISKERNEKFWSDVDEFFAKEKINKR